MKTRLWFYPLYRMLHPTQRVLHPTSARTKKRGCGSPWPPRPPGFFPITNTRVWIPIAIRFPKFGPGSGFPKFGPTCDWDPSCDWGEACWLGFWALPYLFSGGGRKLLRFIGSESGLVSGAPTSSSGSPTWKILASGGARRRRKQNLGGSRVRV